MNPSLKISRFPLDGFRAFDRRGVLDPTLRWLDILASSRRAVPRARRMRGLWWQLVRLLGLSRRSRCTRCGSRWLPS